MKHDVVYIDYKVISSMDDIDILKFLCNGKIGDSIDSRNNYYPLILLDIPIPKTLNFILNTSANIYGRISSEYKMYSKVHPDNHQIIIKRCNFTPTQLIEDFILFMNYQNDQYLDDFINLLDNLINHDWDEFINNLSLPTLIGFNVNALKILNKKFDFIELIGTNFFFRYIDNINHDNNLKGYLKHNHVNESNIDTYMLQKYIQEFTGIPTDTDIIPYLYQLSTFKGYIKYLILK
jgi:hypothetical protein